MENPFRYPPYSKTARAGLTEARLEIDSTGQDNDLALRTSLRCNSSHRTPRTRSPSVLRGLAPGRRRRRRKRGPSRTSQISTSPEEASSRTGGHRGKGGGRSPAASPQQTAPRAPRGAVVVRSVRGFDAAQGACVPVGPPLQAKAPSLSRRRLFRYSPSERGLRDRGGIQGAQNAGAQTGFDRSIAAIEDPDEGQQLWDQPSLVARGRLLGKAGNARSA